jgi:hypothetical protein
VPITKTGGFANPLRACLASRKWFAIFGVERGRAAGMPEALRRRMAAVFALVFLFVLAAGTVLAKVFIGDGSLSSVFALVTFLALAWGVFFGLFKMSRGWENEPNL